jgi:hypothetical protein
MHRTDSQVLCAKHACPACHRQCLFIVVGIEASDLTTIASVSSLIRWANNTSLKVLA